MLELKLTSGQMQTLFNAIDVDKNGEISYDDFLKSFAVVDMGPGVRAPLAKNKDHKAKR